MLLVEPMPRRAMLPRHQESENARRLIFASAQSTVVIIAGDGSLNYVRFGSKADICSAAEHVRFAPNSDPKCGHPQCKTMPRFTRKRTSVARLYCPGSSTSRGPAMPRERASRAAFSTSSSSVSASNAPASPTSRRSMMRPRILALPMVAATAATRQSPVRLIC